MKKNHTNKMNLKILIKQIGFECVFLLIWLKLVFFGNFGKFALLKLNVLLFLKLGKSIIGSAVEDKPNVDWNEFFFDCKDTFYLNFNCNKSFIK